LHSTREQPLFQELKIFVPKAVYLIHNALLILVEINATMNVSSTDKAVEVYLRELDEVIFILDPSRLII
jgi:hypothetical protein